MHPLDFEAGFFLFLLTFSIPAYPYVAVKGKMETRMFVWGFLAVNQAKPG
jgi:hypothetical protein